MCDTHSPSSPQTSAQHINTQTLRPLADMSSQHTGRQVISVIKQTHHSPGRPRHSKAL